MKIAMWSGPRNLSTAMMYSFGARPDCTIVDEPFYAAYLEKTGAAHPMREQILLSQPVDPNTVIDGLLGPNPGGQPIWYQKHMTHHMVPGIPLDWLDQMRNVFLIRHPNRILASYLNKRGSVDFEDLGFKEQIEIFEHCLGLGLDPIVLDSDEILKTPQSILTGLCAALGIQFDPRMISWGSGPRAEDGVWAVHWYDAVHKSTGFGPTPGDVPKLPARYDDILEKAMPIYDQLRQYNLGLT